jgi:hypothetical protein
VRQPFVGNRLCKFIMIRNDYNDRLAKRGWTSICRSSVQNLGDNPRITGVLNMGGTAQMPKKQKARQFKPSHSRVLLLLLKCVPLCLQAELRGHFEQQIKSAKTGGTLKELNYCVSQIGSIDDVYPKPGMQDHTSEFFLLDVIHKTHVKGERDPDEIRMAAACNDSDMEDNMDYWYRTILGFLPGAGVFYDCCNPRCIECGVAKLIVQLDMSWLRLSVSEGSPR